MAWGFLCFSFQENERRYIVNWKTRHTCASLNSTMTKDQESQKYYFSTWYTHSCENWEPAHLFLTDLLLWLCSFNVVMFCNDVILESGWIWSYQMVGQGIDKSVFPIWGISKGRTIFFQFVSQVVNIPTIYVSFPTFSVCSGIVLSDFLGLWYLLH